MLLFPAKLPGSWSIKRAINEHPFMYWSTQKKSIYLHFPAGPHIRQGVSTVMTEESLKESLCLSMSSGRIDKLWMTMHSVWTCVTDELVILESLDNTWFEHGSLVIHHDDDDINYDFAHSILLLMILIIFSYINCEQNKASTADHFQKDSMLIFRGNLSKYLVIKRVINEQSFIQINSRDQYVTILLIIPTLDSQFLQ